MPRASPTSPESAPQTGTFDSEVRSAILDLRQAFSEALEAGGLDPSIPSNVSRSLGIDKSLSWKVCRIVTESDPAPVAARLPGKSGVRIFGAALRQAGVEAEVLTRLEIAIERFRELETRHAADREMFAAMLTGASSSESADEPHRKLAFLGNSAIWGIRTALQFSTQMIAPSASPGKLDMARVGAFVGLQRIRNDIPWAVANISIHDDSGRASAPDQIGAIDPAGMTPDGVPLMPEFSSNPLPTMSRVKSNNGIMRLMLREAPLGRAGSIDIVTGGVLKGKLGMFRSPEDQVGSHIVVLSTPAEVLVHDLFMHRSLGFAMNPRAFIFSQLPSGPLYPADGAEAGAMRIPLRIESLGTPPDLTMGEFAAYPRLVQRMARSLETVPADYVGYRLRLRFPPIPTLSVLRHELADPA